VADGEHRPRARWCSSYAGAPRSIDRVDLDALDSIRSRCGAHTVAEWTGTRSADRHGPARPHREARRRNTRGSAAANPPDRKGRSRRSRLRGEHLDNQQQQRPAAGKDDAAAGQHALH
jgi:hypothetical protein